MNSFILQHLITKYNHLQKPLFVCYVDISKAYDSVPRDKLWTRLHDMGVRGRMLHALGAFYKDVCCSIKFADGVSETFPSNIGVRQGCPLSPFIFGVFIEILHDMLEERLPGSGAVLDYVPGKIPLLMFADDLLNIANAAVELQSQLDVLSAFCSEYGMRVNFSKTKVVVYNARFQSYVDRRCVFKLCGQPVDRGTEYKYLGLMFAQGRTINAMTAHVVSRGHAAMGAMYKKFHQFHVSSNICMKLKLFEGLVFPNLAFGCEVWGPWLLHTDFANKAFESVVEQVRLSFARVTLGLKSSTPSWNVYRELGWYPMHVYIARQLVRFTNKLLDMPVHTWARMALLDAWMMYKHHGCDNWCARFDHFMVGVGLQPSMLFAGLVPTFNGQAVERALQIRCHEVYLTPDCPSKMSVYHAQFGFSILHANGRVVSKWHAAPYLQLPIPSKKLHMYTRFRLACHYLAVETGRWRRRHIDDRQCPLCDLNTVQDEHHHVFVCPRFAITRLEYPDLFAHGSGFRNIQSLFKIHARSGVANWQLVVRQVCGFLDTIGGIYQPIQAHVP